MKEVGHKEEKMLTFKMTMLARCRHDWEAWKGGPTRQLWFGWLVFAYGHWKRAFDSLELELQAAVSHMTRVPGTEQ